MRDRTRAREMDQMEPQGGSAGTFIIGALCGAAIGAAAGVLFAPKAGTETRQQITDRSDRLRRRASERADRLREKASQMYNGASGAVNDVVARSREALEVGRDAFQKSKPHNGAAGDVPASPR